VRTLPLSTNPRAKMQGITEGFVKLMVRPGSHTVIGAVVVAPRASELILPYTMAVAHRMTAEEVAGTFTIYPSLTGSLAELARQMHKADGRSQPGESHPAMPGMTWPAPSHPGGAITSWPCHRILACAITS